MLIVLYCVDGCFFVLFYLIDSLAHYFGFNTQPPPPPPKKKKKNKKKSDLHVYSFFQNSLTRELKIRVVGFVLKVINKF